MTLYDVDFSTSTVGRDVRWSVNDVCTRVRVVDRSGRARVFRLRQYEFENGDHFLKSLLPIGRHALFVTHQHGSFLVSDQGRVLRELDRRPPAGLELRSGRFVRSRLPEGPYDYRLRARGWNGGTILGTDAQDEHGYAVLIDPRLRRTWAFDLGRRRIASVRPDGTRGWMLAFRQDGVWLRIGNDGRWRWIADPKDRP